jgi:predicted SpoU family rRNA methylase
MKKVIRLTEGDLHRIIKESVKKVIREWGDDIPQFIIKSISVNRNDVSNDFFRKFGRTFSSKYDFASSLNEFLEPLGITAHDVDTAREFGEDGDAVYVNTNSNDRVEVHGGYEDLIGGYDYEDDILQ